MKTLNRILVILFATLFFFSCQNDYYDKVYTRIYPDGSCYRDIKNPTDSAFYAGNRERNPFPFQPDSSWSIIVKKVTDTVARGDSFQIQNHYLATALKEYPAVEDMAETFYFDDDEWDSIVPAISYSQRFQWFYTLYDFTETYPPINQLKMVPISEYMSEDEVETWFGENISMYKGKNGVEINDLLNNIENKANAWYNRNYYEEIFSLYLKYFRYIKNLPVDSLSFAMAKDTIFKNNKRYIESAEDPFEIEVDSLIEKHFQRKLIFDAEDQILNTMGDETQWMDEFMIYFTKRLEYGLSLPGKVIETNAHFVSGDTLSWNFDAYRFFINDYSLTAKSRKPNYWAFITTGIIIAFSVIGFRVKRK